MAASASTTDIPTLPETHSGIPRYLLEKAQDTKNTIFNTRTQRPTQEKTTRSVAIPHGVEKDAFFKAISELHAILGPANVELNDKPLEDGWYMQHPNTHDMMPIMEDEEFVSSAVVYPGSTEEVQQVVKWANKHLIPIFPISMGRNLGYGGASPRVCGSVVLDLGRRMHGILDINPEDYTCLVEPGVSYYALYEELQKRGLGDHMWIDTPDLGGGSVIGNALDRGVGYTPYGDHWSAHSGLEAVMPTGEIVRTGMGALEGSNTWACFPYGFGPYLDGIFSQSNFGIVTKMGIALMPNPGGYESFMYTFPREEDLSQIIEIIRPLRIRNILENVAQLRHVVQTLAVRGQPRTHWYPHEGPIPDDVIHSAAASLPVGDHTWAYYGMAYGPPEAREPKLRIIDAGFRKVPGARKIDPATLPEDEYFWSRDRIARGVPDLHELRWCNWVSNGSHVAFSPVSPIRGRDAEALLALARTAHQQHGGFDLFPAFCVGMREMHLIIEVVFDKQDPQKRADALRCLRAMVDEAARRGYGEYRTHLALMDQVAQTYAWGEGALGKLHETIKDAVDPNGILAPGRCGVWPKRFRGKDWEMLDRHDGKDKDGQESRGARGL